MLSFHKENQLFLQRAFFFLIVKLHNQTLILAKINSEKFQGIVGKNGFGQKMGDG